MGWMILRLGMLVVGQQDDAVKIMEDFIGVNLKLTRYQQQHPLIKYPFV